MTHPTNTSCNKPNGSLIFLTAMLMVVAGGGAAFMYVNDNVSTVEQQEQTAAANQGRPHPPRSKMEQRKTQAAKPTATATNDAR